VNTASHEVLKRLPGGSIAQLSPDETSLVVNADPEVSIYSLPDLELLHRWNAPEHGRFFSISPRGDKIAFIISPDPGSERLTVCNIADGTIIGTFDGNQIAGDFISPGGRFLITSPLTVWDLQSTRKLYMRAELPAPDMSGTNPKLVTIGGQDFLRYQAANTLAGVSINLNSKTFGPFTDALEWTDNPQFALHNGQTRYDAVLDADTGMTLFNLSQYRWPNLLLNKRLVIQFAPSRPEFLTSSPDGTCPTTVWRLRRPLAWYGPALLPEFWLTAILSLALIWSIIRDRKTLKPTP